MSANSRGADPRLAFLVALVWSITAQAANPVFVGKPTRIADGDTLTLPGGTRIRFWGIDAPESTQTCKDAQGATYACGEVSTEALRKQIGSSEVSCEQRDQDQYGRVVAMCSVEQPDGSMLNLNEWMVRQGYAVAYTRFTRDVVAAEEEARAARRGLWAGEFLKPWDYRHGTGQPVTAGTVPETAPAPAAAPGDGEWAAAAPAPAGALTDAEADSGGSGAGASGPCLTTSRNTLYLTFD